MATVHELYELWATDSELRNALTRSLQPRGTEWLYDVFAQLEPRPGQTVADVGARDARHAIELVRRHGVRAVAIDPVPLHLELAREAIDSSGLGAEIDVVDATIEDLPLADASIDFVWCRDVLVHVDARRGLAECTRVLRPGGAVVAYVTHATELLAPHEAVELAAALALVPESFEAATLRAAAADAGLSLRSADVIGSEWRERMIEDGRWDASTDLLQVARLHRQRDALVAAYGDAAVAAAWGGLVWGVYQLLGKLRPTVYVWERHA
jgi:SAM-dependent methyltransferase